MYFFAVSRAMDFSAAAKVLAAGSQPAFPADANTVDFARSLDAQDPIRHLRDEFIFPTKTSLKKKALDGTIPGKLLLTTGTQSLPIQPLD